MRMKMKAVTGIMVLATSVISLFAGENLLRNPEFASKSGFLPDYWGGASWKGGIEAYKTENGVVRISEKTSTFNCSLYQTVNVTPGKGYYFSIDMKADQLNHHFGISYMVRDEKGTRLVDSRPLLNRYKGPQKDWVRIGFVIPVGSVAQAKQLTVLLCVYNPTKKPGEDRAVYFRNPELVEYAGQKNVPPPKPTASAGLPDQPFQEHFTGFPLGTPYLLEKGGVGFFRLNSNTMPNREIVMTVSAPAGVKSELYMMKYRKDNLNKIPGKQNRFVIGRGYDWVAWGNSLIFCADETVPEEFSVRMDFECDRKKISFNIPVKQIPGYSGGKLPGKRRYFSWQSMPITQIDMTNPENTLGIRLKEYWEKSGWVDLPFMELAWVIPYSYKPGILKLRQAVDPAGTPVPLYCDSAFAAVGPDFFVQQITQRKNYCAKMKKAKYVTWDYEPYVSGPVTMSCFCPDCIRAFAKANGLQENLTGAEILKNHRRAWVKFRCRQRAASVRTVAEAVKKINPDAAFGFCSFPLIPRKEKEAEYEEVYGILLNLYDDFVDRFASMTYWSSLDFFRSLEREALELKKPKYTLIQNGWTRPYSTRLLGMQYAAAAFCAGEEDFPGIAQGLFISNGEQVREMRKVMNFIAIGEKRWQAGKLVRNSRKILEGFNAHEKYYALERKANDGRSWSLLFNNDERETLFLHLVCGSANSATDPLTGLNLPIKDGKVTVKLAPRSYLLLEFSPEKKAVSSGLPDYAAEERCAVEEYRKKTASGSKYGMRYTRTPDKCVISTPVHSLELNLKNSGEGVWKSGNKVIASIIGRDVFMDQGIFDLWKRDILIEDVSFTPETVKVLFSYTVKEAPYAGLVIRREYTLSRNTPEIKAYIEIVPDGGYRPFRLRTVNNFIMPRPAVPEEPTSEILVGGISDKSTRHLSFIRKGAKFPGGKPFLVQKWQKMNSYPLECDIFAVRPIGGKTRIQLSAPNVDQLFVWRDKGSATLETIWPDAYPDNDPHKVATWKTAYELKLTESR
ncbi:MAG: hypothetical protein E7055_07250 [Lentisphaerae bacterium]|nr:hypothetical protein [Lentisphaerota bacterium]